MTSSERPVTVTTQETLDEYREKTERIVNVENNTIELDVSFISRSTRHDAL